MTTDVELVERCRRRDADAFGALVTRHQQLVFGVALARCQDPALAEDVAQEAFVAAWRDLDRLRDANRVGPWVAGIARNLASNAVRARARREHREVVEPESAVQTPEDAALEREDRELLQRALADIPATHRETLVLFYLQGQSIAEIAGDLALSEDVVKQRLSRARRALRENVADRVESVLTRTRLRPAFGAGVAAALSTATARKAAAGKVIAVMSANKIIVAVVVVAVVAGSAIWLGTRSSAERQSVSNSAAPLPVQRSDSPHAPTAGGSAARPHVEKLPDKTARANLLAAIERARAKRSGASAGAAPSTTATTVPALPPTDVDKEYIRGAVQEILPLLTECYEEGLERDPKLVGDILVEFTIEGEPGVGGLVGDSKIDPAKSSLGDATVRQCIQETMYALKIDPPSNGGSVLVRYPFAFAPSEAEAPPPRPQ